jgi:UDP-N-acetylglucosamine diphosphorylase/glucosamine-1-phosphate N-acetyltransferase
MSKELIIVILAGGLGKRMNSEIPKVLHFIANKPMLLHVIEEARLLCPERILIVVGKYKNIISYELQKYTTLDDVEFIIQPEPLGTGHALQCCKKELLDHNNTNVIILSGDVPLIKSSTLSTFLAMCDKSSIITTILENPQGYGRIIEENTKFMKIIEEKDCTENEKRITKVNCGIYVFDSRILCKYIDTLSNNNSQHEYYLTDIIQIIKENEGIHIAMYEICKEKQHEVMGINTVEQLDKLREFSI